jgi:hypothetical protein
MTLLIAYTDNIVDVEFMKTWINRNPRVKKTREAIFFQHEDTNKFLEFFPELTAEASLGQKGVSLKIAKEIIHERLKKFFLERADKHEKREEQLAQKLETWLTKYPLLKDTDAGRNIYQTRSLFTGPVQEMRKVAADHYPPEKNESISEYMDRIECVVDWSLECALCQSYSEKFNINPILTEYENVS